MTKCSYKCVICDIKVDYNKASQKMKLKGICVKCLKKYVTPKGGKNENK